MTKKTTEPESLGDIMNNRKQGKKPPAHPWQDLALKVIGDLAIPGFKRSAVFKECKQRPKEEIILALNDTKELCQEGEAWKYFFKILAERKGEKKIEDNDQSSA